MRIPSRPSGVLLNAFSMVAQHDRQGRDLGFKQSVEQALEQALTLELHQAFGSMAHAGTRARSQNDGADAGRISRFGGWHVRLK
jgi:hypothetical protein